MEHFEITFEPDGRRVAIHAGATLLQAAGQAGIILNSVCGGRGTCQKCAVVLEPDGRQVLACQYRITSDLVVTIPDESRFFEQRILQQGVDSRIEVRPDRYRKYAVGQPAGSRILGLAVDLGTTTIVAKLTDMVTGRDIAVASAVNPQKAFGDDVVSRIHYARQARGLDEMHRVVIEALNRLIGELCQEVEGRPEEIYEACVVGNTAMNHIFLKLPVAQLGQAPYRAESLDAHDIRPGDLAMNRHGNVHTVENIAGFVGSDTVAAALAVDIGSAEELTLLVDIGTNGEVVLGTADELYAASCAAGPAFEAARIRYGSTAGAGAIEAVVTDGDDINVDVIDGVPARTICGSGLIDALAVLLELNVIDPSGRFVDAEELRRTAGSAIARRLTSVDEQPAFVLAAEAERQVVLTQKDIRESQLAKAAIRAGIKLLQRRLGAQDDDIRCVYLAGAFGNYINPASAARIGLLPDVPLERVRSVGNAAAVGAQMVLVSEGYREQAGALARQIEYVETAHDSEFQDVFADCIALKPR